jgi:hypothetical protein
MGGFGSNAGTGNRFVTCIRSTRRIIGYPLEEQNEPERGWFRTRPQDRTGRSTHRKNNAYCFEDQTIAEAEQMMLNANLGEVFVVTREKLLVGTINIEAIAGEGKKLGPAQYV